MSNNEATRITAKQAMTFSANGHKRALLYARVSSEEQAQGKSASILEQLSEARSLCDRNSWQIIGEFVDDKDYRATQSPKKGNLVNPSGERADRPQFLAMLERVKAGEADVVVCWRDDRLARHPRVASVLEDALDVGDKARGNRPKIEIVDATGAAIDRFVLHIKAVIGREENKRRVERTRLGRVGTLKVGRWPGPYKRLGYGTVKEPDKRGVAIVLGKPSEIQAVKDMFTWYDSGMSTYQISARLIERGIEQKGQNGREHDWHPAIVFQILSCDDYTGKATWHFDDGTEYTIDIPQIITPEQFQRVQDKLKMNKAISTRNAHGVYLLQGIAYCGECEHKLSVNEVRTYYSKRKGKDGTRERRVYDVPAHSYICHSAQVHKNENHPRPNLFNGKRLDWAVWRFVVDKGIKHPELIRENCLARQAELQAQGENVEGEIAHARAKLGEIDQERATYQRQNARGKITDAEFDARMQETEDARKHWQEEFLRLVELRDNATKVSAGLDYVTNLMVGLQERLPEIDQEPEVLKTFSIERQQAILKERQEIIRALCDKVCIKANGHVEIEGLLDGSEAAQFDLAKQLFG